MQRTKDLQKPLQSVRSSALKRPPLPRSLSAADLDLLQAATLELHEPRDLEGLRAIAETSFRRVIPADYITCFETPRARLDDLAEEGMQWESPPRTTRALLQRAVSLMGGHPFVRHIRETGDTGPLRLSDFWSRREQVRSELHQHLLRPLGIGHHIGIPIARGRYAGTITLSRPFAQSDFSDRDLAMLGLLAPHFVQALDVAQMVSHHRATATRALAQLGLTRRESDVALWLAEGKSNPEIALILRMSRRTVEKHVENILDKLGAENRTTAALISMRASVVAPIAPKLRSPDASRRALQRLFEARAESARRRRGP